MGDNAMLELTRIIQNAALETSPEDQVQVIVDAISDLIAVDVCSLYRQSSNQDMVLIASHGLVAPEKVVIPASQGLVGRVVKMRHSVNIKEPTQQPDFYYVPNSKEELFHSFCGVPLVYHGGIIGVLVVQSRRAELLSAQQEALLTTLAAHLALLILALPEPKLPRAPRNQRYFGISGAPGLAIGKVHLLDDDGLSTVRESTCKNPANELKEWQALKQATLEDLEQEREAVQASLGDSLAAVLDAYKMLLEDPSFTDRITCEIKAKKALPWAMRQTVKFFSDQFKAMDDPYLKARHEDIEQLGDKLYRIWRGQHLDLLPSPEKGPLILMGHHVSVSDIVSLPSEQLGAIVCFAGAALSHIAVFANALGIPAVMGVGELSVEDGDSLIVDGDHARITLKPTKALLKEYRKILKARQGFDRELLAESAKPAVTLDGVEVAVMANSGLQADIMPGIRNGADGVGLYRTEIPFMVRESLPSEDEQTAVYRKVVEAYGDKPVYFRTLDIGSDKQLPYLPHFDEENPALGLRGVRFTLDNLQLLMNQYRAILRAAGCGEQVHLLLPMVSSTHELDACIDLLEEVIEQLNEEGSAVCRPKLGVMVEVPGAISLLPFWKEKIDFISVGTNDLSQYLLAVDRNNPEVSKYYDSLHPAVLHELVRIIDITKQCELPVSICGEMASDPVSVIMLLGMGIRKLSMSSAKLPRIKWLIRNLSMAEMEKLLQAALCVDNAGAIRELGELALRELGVEYDK